MGEKVYGHHAIEEALKKAGMGSTLFVQRSGGKSIEALADAARLTGKVAVKKLSKEELERMMPGIELRGALLDMGGPRRGASRLIETTVEEFCAKLEDGEGALVLLLDGITDPHNLGAILRSADQFGADLVLIPERRSVQANETVVKVSSGAAQYVPMAVVTNLTRAIGTLKDSGFWIYGADMAVSDSYDASFPARTAIVLGSEGNGISQLVKKNCDYIISIPMQGHIDSLNVSVAAGILMYEFRRPKR